MAEDDFARRRDRLRQLDVGDLLVDARGVIDALVGTRQYERAGVMLSEWEGLLAPGFESLGVLKSIRSRRGYADARRTLVREQEFRRGVLKHLALVVSQGLEGDIRRLAPSADAYARDIVRFAQSFQLVLENRSRTPAAQAALEPIIRTGVPALARAAEVRRDLIGGEDGGNPVRELRDIDAVQQLESVARSMNEEEERRRNDRDAARKEAINAVGKQRVPAEIGELRSLRHQTALYRRITAEHHAEKRLMDLQLESSRLNAELEAMCPMPPEQESTLLDCLARALDRSGQDAV